MKKYDNMFYEETFNLSPLLPFRLDLTVWTLRRRQKNQIDRWDGKTYSRIFVVNNTAIQAQVTQNTNTLEIRLNSLSPINDARSVIATSLKRMLGLETNIEKFYALSNKDSHLQSLAQLFKGVKPPRFSTVFESLINAIACQQITLDVGVMVLNRLAEKYGRKFEDGISIQYAFPLPENLAKSSEQDLKTLGLSYQKARTIIALSKLLVEEKKSFENMEMLTNKEIVDRLIHIKGIGRWSAEYTLLRGFGRIDTFPGDDVGAQNNLKRVFALNIKPNYEEIKKLTSSWNPYAGLVYFHLLLDKLGQKQLL